MEHLGARGHAGKSDTKGHFDQTRYALDQSEQTEFHHLHGEIKRHDVVGQVAEGISCDRRGVDYPQQRCYDGSVEMISLGYTRSTRLTDMIAVKKTAVTATLRALEI